MGVDRRSGTELDAAAHNGGRSRPTQALVEALGPLDARKADILGALSHQLRNPLTSVLGYLELLADGSLGPLTAEQERALHMVADGVARLCAYVDELDPGDPAGQD